MFTFQQVHLEGLKAVVYRRKSQEGDERQKLSLETQRDVCQEIISYHKLTLVTDYEEKKSARKPDKRPVFNEMMKAITKGKVDVLVCWKIDRLARNMKEGGWLIDLLQSGTIKAIITDEKAYYPNDNTFVQIIEMAAANQFSRDLSLKAQAGLQKKLRMGYPTGVAPLGYVNNKHKEKGERDWRDDPVLLPKLRSVFERILFGKETPNQAFYWARDTLGVRGKSGKPLISSTFYNMLRQPAYAGFFFFGEEKKAISSPITPILSEKEYWTIQEILGKNGTPKPKNEIQTYSGFIFDSDGNVCGPDCKRQVRCECKHKFSYINKEACPKCGREISKMKNARFRHYTYYYSVKAKKNRRHCKSIRETKIDEYLLGYARDHFYFSKQEKSLAIECLNYLKEQEEESTAKLEAQISSQVQALKERLTRAKNGYLEGVFSPVEYQETKRDLSIQIGKLEAQLSSPDDWASQLKLLIAVLNQFCRVIEEGSIEDKREVLTKLGSNLVWNGEKLSIINAKWLNKLIQGKEKISREIQGFEPENWVEKQGSKCDFRDQFPVMCRELENVRNFLAVETTAPRGANMP